MLNKESLDRVNNAIDYMADIDPERSEQLREYRDRILALESAEG